jgi:hypothetical protein
MKKSILNEGQLGLFSDAPPAPAPISKSEFVAGWQCDKYFWFERHERGTKKLDAHTLYQMKEGQAVGMLARQLFPDGEFEVTAEAEGVMARADIVRRAGPDVNLWDLYEVKGSGYDPEKPYAEDRQEFLWDLALQVHAFEAAGKPIRNAHLVLVNTDYVRAGAVDPRAFFKVEDVTSAVRERLAEVPAMLAHFERVDALATVPVVDIGMHCKKPHDCPFQVRCFPELENGHIFKLRMLWWRDKFKAYHGGIRRIVDYPAGGLDPWQAKQVRAEATGEAFIDKAAIAEFLGKLQYPLYHLDFETCNPAIPPFDGIRPFRQTVFQYSLHVQDAPGTAPRHFEYLPAHQGDPRAELLEKMLSDLGTQGTILAYYASFEMTRLKELAEAFPQHKARIEAVLARFQDLEKPFSNGHFVHPAFGGRTSIKVVLPTLVPEMSYEGMAVGEGTAAIRAYMEILDAATPQARRDEIRAALLAYCGQDTLAMVKILGVLEKL